MWSLVLETVESPGTFKQETLVQAKELVSPDPLSHPVTEGTLLQTGRDNSSLKNLLRPDRDPLSSARTHPSPANQNQGLHLQQAAKSHKGTPGLMGTP